MPLISVKTLTKVYDVGDVKVHALRGLTVDIERGEFVSIVGPSGSGKSTLMHILGCLDRPTAGTYLLNGRDVSRLSDDELSAIRNEQIGFVFQGFNLLARTTAVENVELPLLYTQHGRAQAAERFGDCFDLEEIHRLSSSRRARAGQMPFGRNMITASSTTP